MHNRRSSPFWPLSGFRLASLLALVLLLGLATDWYLSFSQSPLFHSPAIDEALHWQWAQALASGQGSPEIPYFRAPLYPWFLGGLARLGLQLSGLRRQEHGQAQARQRIIGDEQNAQGIHEEAAYHSCL